MTGDEGSMRALVSISALPRPTATERLPDPLKEPQHPVPTVVRAVTVVVLHLPQWQEIAVLALLWQSVVDAHLISDVRKRLDVETPRQ